MGVKGGEGGRMEKQREAGEREREVVEHYNLVINILTSFSLPFNHINKKAGIFYSTAE